METLMLLTKIFGISFTSGINLYATVALVGLVIRFNIIGNLPEQLHILSNEYVIGTALFLYVCEFVADKIPAFDSVWDSIHTFIRPFAAAMIALMAAGECPLFVKIIAVLIAGSVALTSHTAKSGIRLVANTSPEPFSNSILSIIEDLGVIALVALVAAHPYVAAAIILVLMAIIFWQGPKLIGFIFFMLKAIANRIVSFVPSDKHVNVEILPDRFNKHLDNLLNESEKVYLTIEATFKGKKKTAGYAVLSADRLIILYKKWFGVKHFEYSITDIKRMCFKSGFLTDRFSFSSDSKQVQVVLFKSKHRDLNDIKNFFRSLGADIVEPVPEMSLSKAHN